MIPRKASLLIDNLIFKGKVIVLIGPRQVGKTTLLRQLHQKSGEISQWLNADEGDIKNEIEQAETSSELLQIIGPEKKLVIIDEAQQIKNIGHKLKLINDTFPHVQVIATGSSSFEMRNQLNEPLTGRKRELYMFPVSFAELSEFHTKREEKRWLQTRLIYGSYPEIINNHGKEKELLIELSRSYLYKDILQLDGLRKASVLEKLLQALAFQIGNEVSYNELANSIGNIDTATVEKYIDLLEKAYVIFKLPALSRNLRNEIKKGKKYYFYDNGIRNVLVNNFSLLESRSDKGALWENYIISERLKYNNYRQVYYNSYFWRTRDQAEIDFIEEAEGILNAFEIKWKAQKVKFPSSFLGAYPNHTVSVVSKDNYDGFLTDI